MFKRRRVWLVLLVGFCIVAAGAMYVTRRLDLDVYRFPLAQALGFTLGRTVEISGPLSLNLGWTPMLTAHGVRITNDPSIGRPESISAKTINISVGLRALLNQQIHIRRVSISDVDLHIGPIAKDDNPLRLPGIPQPDGTANADIEEIELKNVAIHLHKTDNTEEYVVHHARIYLDAEQRYHFDMHASRDKNLLSVHLLAVRAGKRSWEFSGDFAYNEIKLYANINWQEDASQQHKIMAQIRAQQIDIAEDTPQEKVGHVVQGDSPLDKILPAAGWLPNNITLEAHVEVTDTLVWHTHHLRDTKMQLRYQFPSVTIKHVSALWDNQLVTMHGSAAAFPSEWRMRLSGSAPAIVLQDVTSNIVHGRLRDTHIEWHTHGATLRQWLRRTHLKASTDVETLHNKDAASLLYNGQMEVSYDPLAGGRGTLMGTTQSKKLTVELATQPFINNWLHNQDTAMALRARFGNTQATIATHWRELVGATPSMRLMLRGHNLSELGDLLHARLPHFVGYEASAALFIARGSVTASQILIETPASFVTGALYYQWLDSPQPVLKMHVAYSTFDAQEMAEALHVYVSAAPTRLVTGDSLIPDHILKPLLDSSIAMDINAHHVTWQQTPFDIKNIQFSLRAATGVIDGKYKIEDLAQGQMDGSVLMAATPNDVLVKINMDVKGLDYGYALLQAQISNQMQGAADIHFNMIGRGVTLKALLGNASAEVDVNSGGGVILNRYLRLWGDDIARQLLPGNWLQDEHSKLNCAYARLRLKDGMVKTDAILLDTEHITIVGTGGLSLENEELDFVFTPNPKNPSLLSLATPVRIRGKLAHPEIAAHKMATLWTLGTLAAGAVNPVILLARFANLGDLGRDACRQAAGDEQGTQGLPGELLQGLNAVVTTLQRPFDHLPDVELGHAIDTLERLPNKFANDWMPAFSRSTGLAKAKKWINSLPNDGGAASP